jgi:hypothetical protein
MALQLVTDDESNGYDTENKHIRHFSVVIDLLIIRLRVPKCDNIDKCLASHEIAYSI